MIIKLIICKTKPHLFSVAISVSDRRIKGGQGGNTLQVTKSAWYNLLYFEKMDCFKVNLSFSNVSFIGIPHIVLVIDFEWVHIIIKKLKEI